MAFQIDGITFTLASNLTAGGDVEIVLHLYRRDQHTASTALATCNRNGLSRALRKCRAQLESLGMSEAEQPLQASV